jgi:hypothetical protein
MGRDFPESFDASCVTKINELFWMLVPSDGSGQDCNYIGFDPALDALPGCDVLVRMPGDRALFAKLGQDAEGLTLIFARTSETVRMPIDAVICGVAAYSYRAN